MSLAKVYGFGVTDIEAKFLYTHKIYPQEVYDARGVSTKAYKKDMKQEEKIIAVNASPCQKNGHRIRTSSGHCAQCNTAVIAFVKRYHRKGYVYVAYSAKSEITKVGTTIDIADRVRSLNSQRYGGITDWKILKHHHVDAYGRIEFEVQRQLFLEGYEFDSGIEDLKGNLARELFACSPEHAIAILDSKLSVNLISDD